MIIQTSAGQLFQVRETGLDHAWIGTEVKRSFAMNCGDGPDYGKRRAVYEPKAKAREILVRKAATTIVQH